MSPRKRKVTTFMAFAITALPLAGHGAFAKPASGTYHASLSGAAEVPGPGDPDGRGAAHISMKPGKLCYEIRDLNGIATATAAHIHRGASGVSGPPVVMLDTPPAGNSKACADVTDEVAAEIKANPAGFYINVHNAEYPAGAVRGQLAP